MSRVTRVSIIGFGLMGAGLSQLFSQFGSTVSAFDSDKGSLERGIRTIRGGPFGLERLVEKGKMAPTDVDQVIGRIVIHERLDDAVTGADLVIENIYEDLDQKTELFAKLDGICPPNVVLASDTTSLSISSMASRAKHPERIIGMHFFNPPQVMKLVEVMKGARTSERAVETVVEVAKSLQKTPIVVQDSPGFVAARAGLALFMEASRILEEGVASVRDIDVAMRLGFGHPMGPFELTDLIGLDIRLAALKTMHEATRDPRWEPPGMLARLVQEGFVGDKNLKKESKGGYYDYFHLPRQ